MINMVNKVSKMVVHLEEVDLIFLICSKEGNNLDLEKEKQDL
jgi:hypothetical protein